MLVAGKDADVVRAVHRLEHVALDGAFGHARGQLGAAAAFVGQFFQVVALDQRRVLAVGVVREVPRGAVQVQLADVRGEHLAVALALQVLADELLQLVAHHRAFGLPQHQALAHHLVDLKEPQLAADHPVVAGLGFFQLFQMRR